VGTGGGGWIDGGYVGALGAAPGLYGGPDANYTCPNGNCSPSVTDKNGQVWSLWVGVDGPVWHGGWNGDESTGDPEIGLPYVDSFGEGQNTAVDVNQLKADALVRLKAQKCLEFIKKVFSALSPGKTIQQFADTIQSENIQPAPPGPYLPGMAGFAVPPSSVFYTQTFFATGLDQPLVPLHEAFHLAPFRFSDVQLARVVDPSIQWKETPADTLSASAFFNFALSGACGKRP
jgi:hypothetical protein